MKDLKTNFFNQFKKGGLFYKAALISLFTMLLIMVAAIIKVLISPKVGDWIDILSRIIVGFFAGFISLFLFFPSIFILILIFLIPTMKINSPQMVIGAIDPAI